MPLRLQKPPSYRSKNEGACAVCLENAYPASVEDAILFLEKAQYACGLVGSSDCV